MKRRRDRIKQKPQLERRREIQQASCETKRTYLSEGDALYGARNVKKINGAWLVPYQCDICNWWHLASKRLPRFQG